MKIQGIFLVVVMSIIGCIASNAQGLKAFTLKNGLQVYVWEDSTKTDVMGMVAVRTGSVNDPEEYTGLAHYLEHVLFKGTQRIGALDWEKEKPLYEKIIALYDQQAETTDPVEKERIGLEINEATIEAANLSISQEFANIIESMGGTNLNAFTSYDLTAYHNSFPPQEIGKWLQICSERFINPVFRAFQSELETVYEEYNRSNDNPNNAVSKNLLENSFAGTPYSRQIIGLGEHLKNPRLSKLIEFYETWYQPKNMALILSGNVDAKSIMSKLNATFGRLKNVSEIPEQPAYNLKPFEGRKEVTTKVSQYPSCMMVLNGVVKGHKDEDVLDIALRILSNSSETGVLDAKVIDGDLMGATVEQLSFKRAGRVLVYAIPAYDDAQRRFESLKGVEKMLREGIRKVANGEFDQWIVDAIKNSLCRQYDLAMESNQERVQVIAEYFNSNLDMSELLTYKERINAITSDDVKRVAKEYLTDNCLVIMNEKGKARKGERIEKPKYKPVEAPIGMESAYGRQVKKISPMDVKLVKTDLASVKSQPFGDYSHIHHSLVSDNNIFTLSMIYKVGSRKMPLLEYAAELMNNAGIMGLYSSHQMKEELSKIGAVCRMEANEDNLEVYISGPDENLQQAVQLVTRQLLMPQIDDNQLTSVKSSALSTRMVRRDDVNTLGRALWSYISLGGDSPYKKELTDKQIYEFSTSAMSAEIQNAMKFEVDIHYAGTRSFEDVTNILQSTIPQLEGQQRGVSPSPRDFVKVDEDKVIFVNQSDAQQAQLYFYADLGVSDMKEEVLRQALYQYISGDFNGLIMNEIREKNSMAYSAYGVVAKDAVKDGKLFFRGYIGTQNDKAIDATKLMLGILRDMPLHPERIESIKNYIRQTLYTEMPDSRHLSINKERWKSLGYSSDPVSDLLPFVESLTFDDIVAYYEKTIKKAKLTIGIVGNSKMIDLKELESLGFKIEKMGDRKLFNETDTLF